MTNEEAINNIVAYAFYTDEDIPEEVAKALDMAIEALKKAYSFEHVAVKHPVFDDKEFDGWIDRKRCLLFVDPITFEGARALGWEWRLDNE